MRKAWKKSRSFSKYLVACDPLGKLQIRYSYRSKEAPYYKWYNALHSAWLVDFFKIFKKTEKKAFQILFF